MQFKTFLHSKCDVLFDSNRHNFGNVFLTNKTIWYHFACRKTILYPTQTGVPISNGNCSCAVAIFLCTFSLSFVLLFKLLCTTTWIYSIACLLISYVFNTHKTYYFTFNSIHIKYSSVFGMLCLGNFASALLRDCLDCVSILLRLASPARIWA